MPYGFASVVPVGESAVVLPLANGEVSLGVLAKNVELDEGEVMLVKGRSKYCAEK